MPITRMNHAVLYVRDARRTERFYADLLGFRTITAGEQGEYAFMRAPGSDNHHDIAFFTIGADAGPSQAGRETVGLYHIAWEVPTLDELAAMRDRLAAAGALVGMSDHGPNKSLYAKDPDGIEFEVMWLAPAATWGAEEHEAIIRPLDLDAARAAYSTHADHDPPASPS
jgi:catechol-2,3-dioxygenase